MAFKNKIPEWKNEGIEPSEELKTNGFQHGYKPPAGVFNWFWSLVSKCIKEIQETIKINEEGAIPVESGGTGATTTEKALKNLGAASASDHQVKTYTSLGQLGLTNDKFSATDFSANMEVIISGICKNSNYTSAILQIGHRNGVEEFDNFFKSLIAKLITDTGDTALNLDTHSLSFIYTQSHNSFTPAKIEVTIERTENDMHLKVYGCVINRNGDNIQLGKFQPFIHPDGFLPLSGGTMTGGAIGLLGGLGKLTTGNDFVQLEAYKNAGDTQNRRLIAIKSSNEMIASLQLIDWTDGTSKYYKIFGEHNKPTGTYTGNTYTREIATGGIGGALLIYGKAVGGTNGGDTCGIVTPNGAIMFNQGNMAPAMSSEIRFSNGTLYIRSGDLVWNALNSTYTYQVL